MNADDNKTNPPLILIVDDEPKNLQVLAAVLMEKNYNIVAATNGQECLEVIENTVPDLILLDVMMPVLNGFDTCRKIKEQKEFSEIPVIFLTAKVETEDIVEGFDAGGVDYVTKPFNQAELLSRISTHLELKQSKDALRKSEQELRVSNATKDKFFSIIAHDLKNPFNAIIGFAQMLDNEFEELEDNEKKEFIKHIRKSAGNTFKLLENLLIWSRSQKGTIDFTPKSFDLYQTLNNILELNNQMALNKGIELVNLIPESTQISADENMISTILRNLITNSIKFTTKGGSITIDAQEINTDVQKKYIKVMVKDTGIGMPKEIQNKLFDLTENVSTEGTEKESGTGLGLILCKEFVEKHNGNIGVVSEVNQGSTFWFTISQNLDS